LESTAKLFHISASTLGKLFAQKLGISFYHFVIQRRLIHSKLKIEQGNSMEEVALSCGFCDYTAFYRALKKEYGISPREYRQLIS
jgi:AraC-like DNA-binding protein